MYLAYLQKLFKCDGIEIMLMLVTNHIFEHKCTVSSCHLFFQNVCFPDQSCFCVNPFEAF